MSRIESVLARRPIAEFVALTYLFSWGTWFVAARATADPGLLAVVPDGFGPPVAATVVVGPLDPGVLPRRQRSYGAPGAAVVVALLVLVYDPTTLSVSGVHRRSGSERTGGR
ncbi:MAG: hypothetical protein ABEJ76_05325 [Halanaeroarchaeum sp.]